MDGGSDQGGIETVAEIGSGLKVESERNELAQGASRGEVKMEENGFLTRQGSELNVFYTGDELDRLSESSSSEVRQHDGRFDGSRKQRGMQRVLQWPIICMVSVYSLILLFYYVMVRSAIAAYEQLLNVMFLKRKHLTRRLSEASSYEEWVSAAMQLDDFDGSSKWKTVSRSSLYDHVTVQSLISRLQIAMAELDKGNASYVEDVIDTLLRIYSSNLSGLGIDNEAIYSETHCGTKDLIERLVEMTIRATDRVLKATTDELPDSRKAEFFTRARRGYGQTALCLSSGAMMANYHFGTVKGLLNQGLLPNVIAGTSGGSFVAAYVCTRDNEELRKGLKPSLFEIVNMIDAPLWRMIVRYLAKGEMVATKAAIKKLRDIFGDMTFEEAYRHTGRVLCITATSNKKFGDVILLNHVTAPHVTIWSAVLASSAVPPVIKPSQLYVKHEKTGEVEQFRDFGVNWTDGAFKNDVPRKELSETLGVNNLVVSQMNPHIVPFFFEFRGSSGSPAIRRRGSGYRGGFVLCSLETLIRLELIKMMKFVEQFDLLPELFAADFSRVFLQRYTGDVTIYPKRGLGLVWDILNVLTTPDEEAMKRYIERGEQFAWPKIRRIRNHLVLEQTLERCSAPLRSATV